MSDAEKIRAAVFARTASGETLYARDAVINVIDEPDTDASPETLCVDLAQLHLRAVASPLPKQPAAMGWQMTAASLSALASRLLDVVQRTAPGEAARIAEWFSGPFGDGPDLEEHHDWVTDNVSGSWDLTEKWIQEARHLAVQAQQATAAQTKEN